MEGSESRQKRKRNVAYLRAGERAREREGERARGRKGRRAVEESGGFCPLYCRSDMKIPTRLGLSSMYLGCG